jgi:restriction system protein
MPIPDYQTLMLPVLRFASTREHYRLSEVVEALAQEFELTPEEQEALLPAGTQRIFTSRVSWAGTYLKKASLVESIGRAVYRITARGLALLQEHPTRIDRATLKRYDEFVAFTGTRETATQESSEILTTMSTVDELDPLEAFNRSYLSIQQSLAEDLLDMLKRTTPDFFERLVVDLLVAMGYGGSDEDIRKAVMRGKTDQGIDGVIKEDTLGLSHIYLQAKRWKDSTVGSPVVQSFSGSMDQFHATKGVMITTSTFSEEARAYITRIPKTIILIDGKQLVQLMMEHGVGVKMRETYLLHTIDHDYYELEEKLPTR